MSIRDSIEYKKMNSFHACACAEGFCEGENASEDEQLAAWQYIRDTGLWRSLQGFYGRQVSHLVNAGVIE